MYVFLLLSLCGTLCCGQYNDEDWTDPTDMFNYDAATGKMIKQKHNTKENTEGTCVKEGDVACLDTHIAGMMEREKSGQTTEVQRHKENVKTAESNSNPVLRRYLRKILIEAERYGLPEDSSEVYYTAEMVLTKQMVVEIQKFIEDEDWNLGALEDALIRTLVQFRFHNVKEWWTDLFEDYLGIDFGTTIKILSCIVLIVCIIATEWWSRIGWFTQIKRLCMLSFIISLVWNWLYLYKVAFAERQAELAKMHKFDSCGEKISWSEGLLDWLKGASTFQNDPCEEYYKSLMINPALMVPPTKALALTFTDFITEPLKHVGKALGEFLNGLLAEVPVFYQFLVMILIAVIIIVSCYGTATTIGQVLIHRNSGGAPQQSLPPAEPQRPQYRNYVEERRQQPYYIEPEYGPRYRYPQQRRPESLHAVDLSDDRNPKHFQRLEDVDFPLSYEEDGREWRRGELSRRNTSETKHLNSVEMHQRKEEQDDIYYHPQQRGKKPGLESYSGQVERLEDPFQQNSKNLRKNETSKRTGNINQRKTECPGDRSFSQEDVEPGAKNSNADQQRVKRQDESFGGPQQMGEENVENITPGEPPCTEVPPHDESLELKGAVGRDPIEEKCNGE